VQICVLFVLIAGVFLITILEMCKKARKIKAFLRFFERKKPSREREEIKKTKKRNGKNQNFRLMFHPRYVIL
jgi:predicted nucleotidyltransferase